MYDHRQEDPLVGNVLYADYDYDTMELIGRGGFAEVYRLTNSKGKTVAMKKISKQKMRERKLERQVLQEIEIHRNLRHDNIVKFLDYKNDADYHYLFMEYCPDQLGRIIKEQRGLNTNEAIRYFRDIVDGVMYLHGKNIIHRDLSPANILVDRSGRAKICDFGFATRALNSRATSDHNTVCGTPAFMAPEMADRTSYSFEVDLWSLGCMLFCMLTGQQLEPVYKRDEISKPSREELLRRMRDSQDQIQSNCVLRDSAKNLIQRLIQPYPKDRIRISDVLDHPFIKGVAPMNNIAAPYGQSLASLDSGRGTFHTRNSDLHHQPFIRVLRRDHYSRSGERLHSGSSRRISPRPISDRQNFNADDAYTSDVPSNSIPRGSSERYHLPSRNEPYWPDGVGINQHQRMGMRRSMSTEANLDRPLVARANALVPSVSHVSIQRCQSFRDTGHCAGSCQRQTSIRSDASRLRTTSEVVGGCRNENCAVPMRPISNINPDDNCAHHSNGNGAGSVKSCTTAAHAHAQESDCCRSSHRDEHQMAATHEDADCLFQSPIITARYLMPQFLEAGRAAVNVLDNGEIVAQFLKPAAEGQKIVTKIFTISADGLTITCGDPHVKDQVNSKKGVLFVANSVPFPLYKSETVQHFTHSNLPEKYSKSYEYIGRIIDLMKSKTLTVQYKCADATCRLYANEKFEVFFRSGKKVVRESAGSGFKFSAAEGIIHIDEEDLQLCNKFLGLCQGYARFTDNNHEPSLVARLLPIRVGNAPCWTSASTPSSVQASAPARSTYKEPVDKENDFVSVAPSIYRSQPSTSKIITVNVTEKPKPEVRRPLSEFNSEHSRPPSAVRAVNNNSKGHYIKQFKCFVKKLEDNRVRIVYDDGDELVHPAPDSSDEELRWRNSRGQWNRGSIRDLPAPIRKKFDNSAEILTILVRES